MDERDSNPIAYKNAIIAKLVAERDQMKQERDRYCEDLHELVTYGERVVRALRTLIDNCGIERHGESCEAHTEEYCTTDCPDPFTIEHSLENCSCTYGDVLRAKQLLDAPLFPATAGMTAVGSVT